MSKLLILSSLITVLLIFHYYNSQFSKDLLIKKSIQTDNNYNIVRLTDQDAKCLDGTLSAFYWKQGAPDKFMIMFQGGAWCYDTTINGTLINCLGRSKGYLGSSSNYSDIFVGGGLLSRDPVFNPQFYNHTSIYIPYCDGTGHQGYSKNPYNVNGTNIWFRGINNTVLTIEYLFNNIGFGKAQEVIVGGWSAGGLATYTWVDYIADRVQAINPQSIIYGIPDSGIFLDFENQITKTNDIRLRFQNFMQLSNKEVDPVNTECVKTHTDAKWKCMFAEYLVLSIKTPLFFIESQYDSWSIPNILGYNCADSGTLTKCTAEQQKIIANYRQRTVGVIQDSLKRNPSWGAWSPACINHVYSRDDSFNSGRFQIPQNSNWTVQQSINKWIYSNFTTHIDNNPWPSNTPCSGTQ